MRNILSITVVALTLFLGPLPALANDGDAIACEQAGGNYVSGHCEMAKPSSFDLFGKVVVATLVLIALGFGSSK